MALKRGGTSVRVEAVGRAPGKDALEPPLARFIAAETFDGPKHGSTFKTGSEGFGYYLEVAVLQNEKAEGGLLTPAGKSHVAVDDEIEPGARAELAGDANARAVAVVVRGSTAGVAPSEPPPLSFFVAEAFDKPKMGYVFKKGAVGLGYYLEKPRQHSGGQRSTRPTSRRRTGGPRRRRRRALVFPERTTERTRQRNFGRHEPKPSA